MLFAIYTVWIYSCFKEVTCGAEMGTLCVRMNNGSYVSSHVSDRLVVYVFNSGMNICTIGPTTDPAATGARGTRSSSTDKKPAPSPPM